MKLITASGTEYHIDGNKIKRISERSLYDLRDGSRIDNDGDWREVLILDQPFIGNHFRFIDAEWDGVVTTPIVEIIDDGLPIRTVQDALSEVKTDAPSR